jgi:hypothetical protein
VYYNHNPALQNLQKYFALHSLHCLQRPKLFSGGSGRYSSGSPVKHIVDSQMLRFRCRSFAVYISYLRLSSCVYYLLFVVLFVICFFFISEYKNKKVTRWHGLGLTDPNALQTKNGSVIILINSYNLKYTKSWEGTVGSTEFRTPICMSLKKLSGLSFVVIIINHDICDHDWRFS